MMKKRILKFMCKTLLYGNMFIWFSFFPFLASTGFGQVNISFQGNSMSASIHDTSLSEILAIVQDKKGIWYKSNESILASKVTIDIDGLSLEKGLKKILNRFNHAFIYDGFKTLEGIVLLDEGDAYTNGPVHAKSDYEGKPANETNPFYPKKQIPVPDSQNQELIETETLDNSGFFESLNPFQSSTDNEPSGENSLFFPQKSGSPD